MTDSELLTRYVRDGSQEAFAQLVRRHVNLVYGACLRQTRDPHLADDAAQAVFLVLARRAGSLKPGTVLAGWLYNTARYAAANARRGEDRRRHHERKAAHMTESTATQADLDPDAAEHWEAVSPMLDDAMATLAGHDRDAVLLRFMGQKSLKDVGEALGVSEDAAKKRVSRAIDKLRRFFARKGVAISGVAVAATLSTAATAHAAPPALTTAACGFATTAAVPVLQVSTIANGVIAMTQAKILSTAAFALIAVLTLTATTAAIVLLRPESPKPTAAAAPTLPTAPTVPVAAPPPARPLNPQARFTAAYALTPDQVLRLVPPPYPPERIEVVLKPMFGGRVPANMDLTRFGTIKFDQTPDGRLQRRVMSTIDHGTVGSAIRDCLELPYYQLDLPAELRDQPIVGDWVVRQPSTFDERKAALEAIFATLPKPVRLEKRQVEREVIVARGLYEYHHLPDMPGDRNLHLGSGDLTDPKVVQSGGGGGSGTFGEFLNHVADTIDQYVIDETRDGLRRVEWRNDNTMHADDHDDNRDSLLDNLSRQTSLRYMHEMRMVDVWVAAGK
ncbi:MAG TPA: sigma-70 family RNA polymerase sigma factor [Tepidisphaeraceae bacterium]|jgi:RNA polymerase sigma factor (sigma-70 family)